MLDLLLLEMLIAFQNHLKMYSPTIRDGKIGPPLKGHFMVYNHKQKFYITLDQYYYHIGVKYVGQVDKQKHKTPKGLIITNSSEDKLQPLDLG